MVCSIPLTERDLIGNANIICVFINTICVLCVCNAFVFVLLLVVAEYVRRCFDFEEYLCFTSPLWPRCPPAGAFFSEKQASPDLLRCFI